MTVEGMQNDEIAIKTQSDETLYFQVELALTPAQQKKGMMFRTEMGDNEGMLFLFEDAD